MRQILPVILVVGLLVGCESTGRQVSSTVSEDMAAGEIVSPVVVEDEVVFEPVMEEAEVDSSNEPVMVIEESSEDTSETLNKDEGRTEEAEPAMDKPADSPPKSTTPPESQNILATPDTPKKNIQELVQPKKLQDVYFDFDEAAVLDVGKPILEANGKLLQGHFKHLNVLIEGHCDERGSVEYNLVLGVRRAQVVKAYLIDLGIAASRLRIVSFGKERPVCTNQDDTCWQQNRRVHFVLQ